MKTNIKKTLIPLEAKAFFDEGVTIDDMTAVNSGIIWHMRHNIFVNEYIISRIPSNPPLQLFELYELWDQFIQCGLGWKHYPTVKHVADRVVKWLKEQLRNSVTIDLRLTRTLSLFIHHASLEKYNLAMKSYFEMQNQDISIDQNTL
jgi:hypothetical protein